WMQPTTTSFRSALGSPNSTAVMGRPCTDRPSVSVCTGGRAAGTAWAALGDGDVNGDGDGNGEAADGTPVGASGVPPVAVAVGDAAVAR
ncbi:MAG: hypothetical protein QOD62_2772, partial [Actinomycetota bacterium]|nr:hypothetical protein [Actinomycetota bacterium]